MSDSLVLHTARLTLREITEEDAPVIVALRSDPAVYRFFLKPHKITLEEHLRWYHNSYRFDETRRDWIGKDASGNTVGVFGAKRLSAYEAEASYLLSPEYYGQGYAHEAMDAITEFCTERWNTRAMLAVIHDQNANSIRFAVKLGFKKIEDSGGFSVYRKNLDAAKIGDAK